MFDTLGSYAPYAKRVAGNVASGAKKTGTFIAGTWSDDFGKITSNKVSQELGLVENGTKFRDVFQRNTWKAAGENLGKFRGIKNTSLYKDPIGTIQNTYAEANAAVAKQAAEKAAAKAAGNTSKGFLAKTFSTITKALDPAIKTL